MRASPPSWPGCPPTSSTPTPSVSARSRPHEVNAAIAKHVHARDLAITMVSTASVMRKLLVQAKIKDTAIDVVGFEQD